MLLLLLALTTLGLAMDVNAADDPRQPYPETRTVDQVDDYHGQRVPDPYRWLEADVRESEEVAQWVQAQQQYTERRLHALPERQAFIDRLTELWNFERYSTPRKAGERYLYTKNDGLQDQAVLYVADRYDAAGRVLLDPNTWSGDGSVALAGYAASEDGRLLAYQKSEAGSDWVKIRVMDTATGAHLNDALQWVKFSMIVWDKPGEGFYYKRYPEPEAGEQHQTVSLNPAIYYHKVGTPQDQDPVVYRVPEHPDWSIGISRTFDGRYLLATNRRGTDWQNELSYRPTDSDGEFTPLVSGFDALFAPVACHNQTLYLLTDYQAPRRRLVAMDLDNPGLENLTEIIPESDAALEDVAYVGGKLIASYLRDVAAEVKVYSLHGRHERDVPLPGLGSVVGFRGKPDQTETFFTYHSYNAPPSTYRYDIAAGETTLVRQPDLDVDFDRYVVERTFYHSKDGARVPLFLAYKRGVERDGTNPTLLYGYGGFSISITPSFSISRTAWMERGGVLAVANLRGGGEYGEAWHQAGKLDNKQNVFDDFIAAAEWLCDNKVTRPARLGIQGRSNGGLLVGAAMVQRPDLFGACLPAVGVMDMLRFHRFTAGQFWRSEYGDADLPDQFPALYAYSPYHNLQQGVCYPPTLISTADTDDRVVPMHSFKFGARLQAVQGCENPILLDIETRAGHGAGTPTSKLIEQAADNWAFLWEHLN